MGNVDHTIMRFHLLSLRVVGLGLVVFACQSTLAAMFSVEIGSCTLSGDCIRTPNYPSYYPNYASCSFTTLAAGTVSTTAFNTESSYDRLGIGGGTYYSGTTGPAGVPVTSGQQMTWGVDGSGQSTGWELCLTSGAPTPSPTTAGPTTAATTRMSTNGTCTLSTSGDCVSSPNYPSRYDSTDCTITNNQAGYLNAATFNTESNYDTLNIRRRGLGAYSGQLTAATRGSSSAYTDIYLGAGEQITWTSDTSVFSTGWQICNTAAASGDSSATCCPSGSCGTYTGSCGALATESDCWSYSAEADPACYADSADGCCETNGGAVAGILIASLVFCVIIPVVCCCCFCGSCPLAKSRNQKTVVHVQQIQPPPVSQPTAPIMHQPIQPPPQAIPMAAQPIAMVAQPMMKQEAPPMAPPPPGQSGVQYGAAPAPPPYQPQGASVAPSAQTAFCANCGTANDSGGAFCASCGAQF